MKQEIVIILLTIIIWLLVLIPVVAHILWGKKDSKEVIELDEHEDAITL